MNFLTKPKRYTGLFCDCDSIMASWKGFPGYRRTCHRDPAGMLITLVWTNKGKAEPGIKWTSKIILQTAVVLLDLE